MNEYKLLKDSFCCAKGVKFKEVEIGWYQSADKWVLIHKNLIDGNPTLFELIEEKEFTESDMWEGMRKAVTMRGLVPGVYESKFNFIISEIKRGKG